MGNDLSVTIDFFSKILFVFILFSVLMLARVFASVPFLILEGVRYVISLCMGKAMKEYICPNCGNIIVGDDLPPEFHGFCFECGEWVDFERKGGDE